MKTVGDVLKLLQHEVYNERGETRQDYDLRAKAQMEVLERFSRGTPLSQDVPDLKTALKLKVIGMDGDGEARLLVIAVE